MDSSMWNINSIYSFQIPFFIIYINPVLSTKSPIEVRQLFVKLMQETQASCYGIPFELFKYGHK